MSRKTKSEQAFEDYCTAVGIAWTRIDESDKKRPDYSLEIDGRTVIAEVKEVDRNPEEQESDRQLEATGVGKALGNTPGQRVRKKITAASKQIKALTEGHHPGILVLTVGGLTSADWFRALHHLEPQAIMTAMYGLQVIEFAVPRDPSISPYSVGSKLGPKKKMTDDANTSISAVAVLEPTPGGVPRLVIYRNLYAAIPIEPVVITRLRAVQRDIDLERMEWITVESGRRERGERSKDTRPYT